MKRVYLKPAIIDVQAGLELPLAASEPKVYHGELGSRRDDICQEYEDMEVPKEEDELQDEW